MKCFSMEDSISISNIPCNVNRPEEAVRADRIRYQKQVQQFIDELDSDDDEEEEADSSEESENECGSERSCISEQPETSMLNSNYCEQSERPVQQTSYAEQSIHTDASLNGQHSCCESSSEECLHSFHTQTQGPSEAVSYVDEKSKNEDFQTNGHSASFSDHHAHNRLQKTSYADSNGHGGYAVNGSLSPVANAELEEKIRSLQILYESTCEELQQVRNAGQTCQKNAEQQKQIFENQIYLLNDEKEELFSRLQSVQTLISEYESKNKSTLSEVRSLETQLADVIEARNEALSKLESSEITVLSLEKQLRELQRSENLSRYCDQQDRILEDLKMRHQKEVLQYKENIDKLQACFNSKVQDAENLTERNFELQQKCKELQQEKIDQFNDLSTQIVMAQEKYQHFLKSGTAEELNLLKLQVQRLQEENFIMNKQNEALKDNIKSLKVELSTSETLQRLAFSSKTQTLQETSDGRQKELNLQSELENSLKNVRTLRTENSDLKKQLKDSENELAQVVQKIRLYKSQIAESEKNSKELEEKLKYLTSNESISVTFHEKKIKSLENELQVLKINSHDMTRKLKEASSNEKCLLENNEDLRKRMGEMMQNHSEEKIKSVEECRLKYLELHENVLRREKEKHVTKAEKELKDVCVKYENTIADLQEKKTALTNELYELKSQHLAITQDNHNLKMKLDQVYQSKERGEIEKVHNEYDRQLKQMKEHFIKQKDEYLEKCLKVETEQAQIEWTNKKMAEIKIFIDTTKQRLDEEFKNCLQKERFNLQHEFKIEKDNLERDYNEKLKDLKQQYDQEKHQYSTQLTQNFQSKWLQELAMLKESHERETKHIKHQLENKLSLAEKELNTHKEKLFVNSKMQEEVEKIRQEFIEKQRLFGQEKAQLLLADSELKENVKSLVQTEKRLREKLTKYQRHTCAIKKRHEEQVTKLQGQLFDLQKFCEEKQNQLNAIRSRNEQQLMEFGEKFRKQRNICSSSETQTEEEMVSKKITSNMETKFFQCLQNISGEIRQYLMQSKNRNAEKQQASLQLYHQQMYSKMIQELSNEIRSLTPTFVLPRAPSSVNSKETFDTFTSAQDFQNGQFKTSTPGIGTSSAIRHAQSEMGINKRISSPNLSALTKPKSLPAVNFRENAEIFSRDSNYFSSIYKNSTPTVDVRCSGDAPGFPEKISSMNGHAGEMDLHNGKDIETVGLGDISYDFIPIHLPAGLYDSGKLPNGGLFEHANSGKVVNFQKDSLPVKLLSQQRNAVS